MKKNAYYVFPIFFPRHSFMFYQTLNQARAACAAWMEEAEEAKIEKEQKEKERDEERKKKEEALIACERLSAKVSETDVIGGMIQ